MNSNSLPILYAENPSNDPHGMLTREHLLEALGGNATHFDIVIADANSPNFEALCAARYFVSTRFDVERMREHAQQVRVVHCLNAGVERYAPFSWLPQGAVLSNSSGVHADMVGEYGVMALLMLNHHMPRYVAFQRERRWHPLPGRAIAGKRVLVIGTGGLGANIAARAQMLGVDLIGVNRSGAPHAAFNRIESSASLDTLLPTADFVILACPLTDETRHLINETRLKRFKRGANLINVGRGSLIDTSALVSALRDGQLAGAVLDVQEVEPLPQESPWWDVGHLILTPHISCDTDDGYLERGLAILAENLAAERTGEELRNVVNLQLGY